MNSSDVFERDWLKDRWLRLLGLVDYCNRAVKTGEWYEEDREQFYLLKDALMDAIMAKPPPGATVHLARVPYLRRCVRCKDAAGEKMRHDPFPKGFEYYLGQVPPCPQDTEAPERETFEMEIVHFGRCFCFHIPSHKARQWGIESRTLPVKEWVPAPDFYRRMFRPVLAEIELLLAQK